MANSNEPATRIRIGSVTASVWKNDKGYSVTLQRSYKDGEEWKQSNSFFPDDLLNAAKVLERAEEYIARK